MCLGDTKFLAFERKSYTIFKSCSDEQEFDEINIVANFSTVEKSSDTIYTILKLTLKMHGGAKFYNFYIPTNPNFHPTNKRLRSPVE